MALVPCRECGVTVSTEAPTCPHCGVPDPGRTSAPPAAPPASALPSERPASPRPATVIHTSDTLAEDVRPFWARHPAATALIGLVVGLYVLQGAVRGCGGASPSGRAGADARTGPVRLKDRLDSATARGDTAEARGRAVQLLRDFPGSPQADTVRAARPDLVAVVRQQQQADSAQAEARRVQAEAGLLAAKWSYSANEDPMTGRTTRSASIQSENTVSFQSPYAGPQHGTLFIRDHPQYGKDVMLSIERGQILCRSYDGCTVKVRFDEGPMQTWAGGAPSDNSSETVFIQGAARFVQRMRSAKTVRIQVEVYQEGAPIFEFAVGGYNHARYTGG